MQGAAPLVTGRRKQEAPRRAKRATGREVTTGNSVLLGAGRGPGPALCHACRGARRRWAGRGQDPRPTRQRRPSLHRLSNGVRGPAHTCRPPGQESGAGAGQELGSQNPTTQDAELFPEPSDWHLDRALLSAFGSWRYPLLGLLLDMCAPGGCGSKALAGGFRILGPKGQLPARG